ncbi:hypothetical protein EG68_10268 [Paragonimus skrjabini miyazakii]|uniref:Uncharacterized protein n=1 Tax=Paragonimus skrjabini miyazakii TaxID=59628 RepID=A0A8S9YG48_9TREM|nr:hypothetical protein EG68_10268 [Paragonimus skrjabini miyazakii]
MASNNMYRVGGLAVAVLFQPTHNHEYSMLHPRSRC